MNKEHKIISWIKKQSFFSILSWILEEVIFKENNLGIIGKIRSFISFTQECPVSSAAMFSSIKSCPIKKSY